MTENWGEIERTRNERGNDGKIKLSISAHIDYNGAERTIKTGLAFGVRHKDARESVINPLQPDLDGIGDNGEAEA